MARIKYVARRSFEYLGTTIKAGDEFVPAGARNDENIIERLCWTQRSSDRKEKVNGRKHKLSGEEESGLSDADAQ